MPLIVSFGPPSIIGQFGIMCLGRMRATESIALNGTTTAVALDGEIAMITSTEASTIGVAHGATPDGAATSANAGTSAFYPVTTQQTFVVRVATGDKFSAKALA